ncbi:MAG: tRNA (adenosine(37)-N6)-threonylcarbamoyltransferase complex dimerization subunit type 1 TsaB, partial [Synergistaceae bacterium]|nr:tRNA (adenosine(37)-N6)-threonylcarbamoyltransferase complex dimerization subunit type 1 TsaB [Synergistaceae bacterium]
MSEFLLSVDCSSGWTSLGLAEDGEGVGELNLRTGRRQSELLPVMVDFFLNTRSLKVSDVSFYSVAVGPGSFTGIKVGIVFTQFLAWAEGKKVIPLSSLEILALDTACSGGMILPLLWAGGGKIYASLYRNKEGENVLEESFHEGAYTPEEISGMIESWKGENIIQWVTDAPEKIKGLFGQRVPSTLRHGLSRGISAAKLAWSKRGEA